MKRRIVYDERGLKSFQTDCDLQPISIISYYKVILIGDSCSVT